MRGEVGEEEEEERESEIKCIRERERKRKGRAYCNDHRRDASFRKIVSRRGRTRKTRKAGSIATEAYPASQLPSQTSRQTERERERTRDYR